MLAALGLMGSACRSEPSATQATASDPWTLTASPCDGVEIPTTIVTTAPTLPATLPPEGETTSTVSPVIAALVELAAVAAPLSPSDTFAGYWVDGDTVLVRTKDGLLPTQFSRFADVLTFDVRTAQFSAKERECIGLRLAAVHDPVCDGVANRISGLEYQAFDDRTVVWLKPLAPETTAGEVGSVLGVDPRALRVEPSSTSMEPGTYPPLCPPSTQPGG